MIDGADNSSQVDSFFDNLQHTFDKIDRQWLAADSNIEQTAGRKKNSRRNSKEPVAGKNAEVANLMAPVEQKIFQTRARASVMWRKEKGNIFAGLKNRLDSIIKPNETKI